LNRPISRSQEFRIKYLENGESHDVGHSGGPTGNHLWAFD